MKHYLYGAIICFLGIIFYYFDFPLITGLLVGFGFGFGTAVNRMYKAMTGEELTEGEVETRIYDKIL